MADTNPEEIFAPQIVFELPGAGEAALRFDLPLLDDEGRVGTPVGPLRNVLGLLPEDATVWIHPVAEDVVNQETSPIILFTGRVIIDSESHRVKIDDNEVEFALKEFDLLHLLAKRFNKVVTRNEIVSEVWGEDFLYIDHPGQSIKVHISRVRKKLGKDLKENLQSVRDVGYRLSDKA